MNRVRFAANILRDLHPTSVLDVGCRDGELADHLNGTEYHGADLVPGARVTYAGDIQALQIDRTFDVVTALDILEHLENPSALFDRLLQLAERHFLISLPNTYDLKSKWQFLKGDLGGKYRFTEEWPQDRHRWLMSYAEIDRFLKAKADKHGLKLTVHDLRYGASGNRSGRAKMGRLAARVLPAHLATATVFGLFTRPDGRQAR